MVNMFIPNREVDAHYEIKRLADEIGKSLGEASIRIYETFNKRLEKHGYDS